MEQQQVKLNFSLDKTQGVTCEKCDSQTFQEGLLIRKASKFLTGTAQDAVIPIPTFVCKPSLNLYIISLKDRR